MIPESRRTPGAAITAAVAVAVAIVEDFITVDPPTSMNLSITG
jgi:hypothetical protein